MKSTDIVFDGRAYHYRQYSYDHREDAEAYARIERERGITVPADEMPFFWRQYFPPTPEESCLMRAFGIRYEGAHYRYGPYTYDALDDAVRYARLAQFA